MATGRGARLDEVRPSGRIMSVTIEPLLNQHKTCGFVRIVRDVAEVRFSQDQLLKAEQFATLGQILFGIAHDVGTPLNIISGYSEFLLMRIGSEDPGHKELSAILHQTKQIATLILKRSIWPGSRMGGRMRWTSKRWRRTRSIWGSLSKQGRREGRPHLQKELAADIWRGVTTDASFL